MVECPLCEGDGCNTCGEGQVEADLLAVVRGQVDEDQTVKVAPVPVDRWVDLVRPPGYRSIADLMRDPRQVGGWGDEGQGELRDYMRDVNDDLGRRGP